MPTYDYECRACGKTFEIFQSMSEAPKTKCPACGKKKLTRLISAGAGLLFKGSGFYITDYRSSDYKARAKAESEGSASKPSGTPEASGSSDAKSKPKAGESAPAKKPPSKD